MNTKQRIIEILVNYKTNQLRSDRVFARRLLTEGFAGFANMNSQQLRTIAGEAGLEFQDDMTLLLHQLLAEEALQNPIPKKIEISNPLLALADEIRRYFNEDASPAMVHLMLEKLGRSAKSVEAHDNFKGLDALDASQLRKVTPVSLSLRENVRALLNKI